MPIFEFACRACGDRFEELMSHAQLEAGGIACPQCGSTAVQRSLSSFATGSGAGQPACGGGGCGAGFT